MKRAFFLFFLLFAFSCARHELPTEALNPHVYATVLECGTNTGIAGATLEVRLREDGPVAYSALTDTNGKASVSVPPDVQVWGKVVPPSGYRYPSGVGPVGPGFTGTAGSSLGVSLCLERVTAP